MNAHKGVVPRRRTVTLHAVERYQERWAPDLSRGSARAELLWLLEGAKQYGRTHEGSVIMISGERPEVRMVMQDERVCVTVLPPNREYNQSFGMNPELMEDLLAESELFRQSAKVLRNSLRQEEIDNIQKELKSIDEQRKRGLKKSVESGLLGNRKGHILNRLQNLQKEMEP